MLNDELLRKLHRSSFIVQRAVGGLSSLAWSFAALASTHKRAIAFRAGST
jgi:hypothetical protein